MNVSTDMRLDGFFQKSQEVLAITSWFALTEDLPGTHVQRGEQIRSYHAGRSHGCVSRLKNPQIMGVADLQRLADEPVELASDEGDTDPGSGCHPY
jgi:hypothetical protein